MTGYQSTNEPPMCALHYRIVSLTYWVRAWFADWCPDGTD